MDETQHNPDQSSNQPISTEDTPKPEAGAESPARKRTFERLCDAMDSGAARAKVAADKAAPKIKSAAEKTFYWTAYGLSYASLFSWTLAKNLAGESSKSGFQAGVSAGTEAANRWVESLNQRREASKTEPPKNSGTSETEIQPTLA